MSCTELIRLGWVCREFYQETETAAKLIAKFVAKRHFCPGVIDSVIESAPRIVLNGRSDIGFSSILLSPWKSVLCRINSFHDSILLMGGHGGAQTVELFRPFCLRGPTVNRDPVASTTSNAVVASASSASATGAAPAPAPATARTGVWQPCANMNHPRQCFTAVLYRGLWPIGKSAALFLIFALTPPYVRVDRGILCDFRRPNVRRKHRQSGKVQHLLQPMGGG